MRAFLILHRWVGLTLGLVLTLSGLTGVALVVFEPLDEWAHRELLVVPGAALTDEGLDRAAGAIAASFPGADVTMRLPLHPAASLEARVRGSFKGSVYFNPGTGQELGRRDDATNPFQILFELHSQLLSGDTGKLILFIAAIGFLVMLIAGYVLWWPKSIADGFRVKWSANIVRVLLDLHRAFGAALGLLILVSVFTGAWMAWRPLAAGVNAVVGTPAAAPPKITPVPGAPRIALSKIVRTADAALPGGVVSIVPLPPKNDRPLRIRKKLDDEVHPNGLSLVWQHPQTGAVLATQAWREADVGTKGFEYFFPLHAGKLGGVLHQVLIALCGAALASFGLSGIYLWWKRGRRML